MKNREEIIVINSIDEITEVGIRYAHSSKPLKWISIDKDGNEYCLYGMISGDLPTFATGSNWNQVKFWKKFNGVIKAIKIFSKNGSWGLRHWDNE